jgi:hypothetical protein
VEGCTRPHLSRGLCALHYNRLTRTGSFGPVESQYQPRPEHCQHPDGCPEPVVAKGWCARHRFRLAKHGELGPAGKLTRWASGFDIDQPGVLYLLWHPEWCVWKYGITNDPDTRLTILGRLGYTVREQVTFEIGQHALDAENALKDALRARGVPPGLPVGHSPGWSETVAAADWPGATLADYGPTGTHRPGTLGSVTRTCTWCAADFTVPRATRRVTCTEACRRAQHAAATRKPDPQPRPCASCGTVFTPARKRPNQRHCRRGCSSHRYPPAPSTIACEQCGKEASRRHRAQRFCSKACANRNQAQRRVRKD